MGHSGRIGAVLWTVLAVAFFTLSCLPAIAGLGPEDTDSDDESTSDFSTPASPLPRSEHADTDDVNDTWHVGNFLRFGAMAVLWHPKEKVITGTHLRALLEIIQNRELTPHTFELYSGKPTDPGQCDTVIPLSDKES